MKENQTTVADYVLSKQCIEIPTELLEIVTNLQIFNFKFTNLYWETFNYLRLNVSDKIAGDYDFELEGYDHIINLSKSISDTISVVLSEYSYKHTIASVIK